jgi:Mg2+ and Co2+ transporter CorA
MNMSIHEIHSKWSYPIFWIVCIMTAVGMLLVFKRRNWL